MTTETKSTTKGRRKGKAGGSERSGGRDATLASAILSRVFRTKEERRDAAEGVFKAGSVLEAVSDLAHEYMSIQVFHPDILPHALPVILREARAHVARKGFYQREVRALLDKLESAATGEGGGR